MNGLGPFCAFMASVTWAVGSSNYSKISRDYSPFTLNFTRAAFALPCFLIACLIQFFCSGGLSSAIQAMSEIRLVHIGWFSLSVLASYGLGDAFFLWSSQLLGVPGALAIASIYPIWTALIAAIFHGEILSLLQYFGLIVAVGGIITVILSETRSPSNHPKVEGWITRGVILALVSSFFWTLNSYAISRVGSAVSPFLGNAVRMAMAMVLVRILVVSGKVRAPALLPFSVIKKFAWVLFFETFGGSFFFVYGLSHSPLPIAATLTSLAPVLSVPVAVALKIERYSFKRTLGVCLVVIGLCLLMGAGLT